MSPFSRLAGTSITPAVFRALQIHLIFTGTLLFISTPSFAGMEDLLIPSPDLQKIVPTQKRFFLHEAVLYPLHSNQKIPTSIEHTTPPLLSISPKQITPPNKLPAAPTPQLNPVELFDGNASSDDALYIYWCLLNNLAAQNSENRQRFINLPADKVARLQREFSLFCIHMMERQLYGPEISASEQVSPEAFRAEHRTVPFTTLVQLQRLITEKNYEEWLSSLKKPKWLPREPSDSRGGQKTTKNSPKPNQTRQSRTSTVGQPSHQMPDQTVATQPAATPLPQDHGGKGTKKVRTTPLNIWLKENRLKPVKSSSGDNGLVDAVITQLPQSSYTNSPEQHERVSRQLQNRPTKKNRPNNMSTPEKELEKIAQLAKKENFYAITVANLETEENTIAVNLITPNGEVTVVEKAAPHTTESLHLKVIVDGYISEEYRTFPSTPLDDASATTPYLPQPNSGIEAPVVFLAFDREVKHYFGLRMEGETDNLDDTYSSSGVNEQIRYTEECAFLWQHWCDFSKELCTSEQEGVLQSTDTTEQAKTKTPVATEPRKKRQRKGRHAKRKYCGVKQDGISQPEQYPSLLQPQPEPTRSFKTTETRQKQRPIPTSVLPPATTHQKRDKKGSTSLSLNTVQQSESTVIKRFPSATKPAENSPLSPAKTGSPLSQVDSPKPTNTGSTEPTPSTIPEPLISEEIHSSQTISISAHSVELKPTSINEPDSAVTSDPDSVASIQSEREHLSSDDGSHNALTKKNRQKKKKTTLTDLTPKVRMWDDTHSTNEQNRWTAAKLAQLNQKLIGEFTNGALPDQERTKKGKKRNVWHKGHELFIRAMQKLGATLSIDPKHRIHEIRLNDLDRLSEQAYKDTWTLIHQAAVEYDYPYAWVLLGILDKNSQLDVPPFDTIVESCLQAIRFASEQAFSLLSYQLYSQHPSGTPQTLFLQQLEHWVYKPHTTNFVFFNPGPNHEYNRIIDDFSSEWMDTHISQSSLITKKLVSLQKPSPTDSATQQSKNRKKYSGKRNSRSKESEAPSPQVQPSTKPYISMLTSDNFLRSQYQQWNENYSARWGKNEHAMAMLLLIETDLLLASNLPIMENSLDSDQLSLFIRESADKSSSIYSWQRYIADWFIPIYKDTPILGLSSEHYATYQSAFSGNVDPVPSSTLPTELIENLDRDIIYDLTRRKDHTVWEDPLTCITQGKPEAYCHLMAALSLMNVQYEQENNKVIIAPLASYSEEAYRHISMHLTKARRAGVPYAGLIQAVLLQTDPFFGSKLDQDASRLFLFNQAFPMLFDQAALGVEAAVMLLIPLFLRQQNPFRLDSPGMIATLINIQANNLCRFRLQFDLTEQDKESLHPEVANWLTPSSPLANIFRDAISQMNNSEAALYVSSQVLSHKIGPSERRLLNLILKHLDMTTPLLEESPHEDHACWQLMLTQYCSNIFKNKKLYRSTKDAANICQDCAPTAQNYFNLLFGLLSDFRIEGESPSPPKLNMEHRMIFPFLDPLFKQGHQLDLSMLTTIHAWDSRAALLLVYEQYLNDEITEINNKQRMSSKTVSFYQEQLRRELSSQKIVESMIKRRLEELGYLVRRHKQLGEKKMARHLLQELNINSQFSTKNEIVFERPYTSDVPMLIPGDTADQELVNDQGRDDTVESIQAANDESQPTPDHLIYRLPDSTNLSIVQQNELDRVTSELYSEMTTIQETTDDWLMRQLRRELNIGPIVKLANFCRFVYQNKPTKKTQQMAALANTLAALTLMGAKVINNTVVLSYPSAPEQLSLTQKNLALVSQLLIDGQYRFHAPYAGLLLGFIEAIESFITSPELYSTGVKNKSDATAYTKFLSACLISAFMGVEQAAATAIWMSTRKLLPDMVPDLPVLLLQFYNRLDTERHKIRFHIPIYLIVKATSIHPRARADLGIRVSYLPIDDSMLSPFYDLLSPSQSAEEHMEFLSRYSTTDPVAVTLRLVIARLHGNPDLYGPLSEIPSHEEEAYLYTMLTEQQREYLPKNPDNSSPWRQLLSTINGCKKGDNHLSKALEKYIISTMPDDPRLRGLFIAIQSPFCTQPLLRANQKQFEEEDAYSVWQAQFVMVKLLLEYQDTGRIDTELLDYFKTLYCETRNPETRVLSFILKKSIEHRLGIKADELDFMSLFGLTCCEAVH